MRVGGASYRCVQKFGWVLKAPPGVFLEQYLNKLLFVDRGQTGGDLLYDFERQLHLEASRAFDEVLKRFPLYKLHRVKVVLIGSAQVEDRRNIRVTNARRRAGFASNQVSEQNFYHLTPDFGILYSVFLSFEIFRNGPHPDSI
jgi:hypothetical protein